MSVIHEALRGVFGDGVRLRAALERAVVAAGVLGAVGCQASTPGARPHDMSASAHLEAAAREEDEALRHARQYDPNASTTLSWRGSSRVSGDGPPLCYTPTPGTSSIEPAPLCWTSTVNPTEQHRREADEHRLAAAHHRAAARELREAEARECGGVAEIDRDISPFYHREDILRVEPLYAGDTLRGATVIFRPVPGMTAEQLQRVVDCHIARNAAMGHERPEMTHCPLSLAGIYAAVVTVDGRLAIAVQSADPRSAAEILWRAQGLVGR